MAFFNKKEFACKCGCGFDDLNQDLIDLLEQIRTEYKKPIIINSGCRCEKHNKNIGGSPNSSHVKGLAVDIACQDSTTRYELLKILVNKINRIGIAKNFIHIDIDSNKSQNVTWLY